MNVTYDPRICACRRRIEWPTPDANIRDIIASDQACVNTANTPISETFKAIAEQELKKCDTRRGSRSDLGVLATMIVRSGTELPKLFETIHASGILGPSIEEEYEQSMGSGLDTTISQNPQELAGVLGPDGHPFLVRTILDFGCRMAWAPPTKLNRSRNV
ncbi:hypothetical protein SI65_08366 [Aspergillus cristatus]|uniref:Uncharacterized protein n=1 Tax=Aspergillus cristatus TaxID=573508 RepID=A0A1E3B7I2_ASPCR|nr:hypothetical protein SI65_08366 [Aspergillus cristatus]